MSTRVAVNPELLRWARERAGLELAALAVRFKKLAEWEAGERQPTFKQLEDFANAVHVPFGYLFLPEPPAIQMPIPDFRTVDNADLARLSPDLLDTIYAMQDRQAFLRDDRADGDLPDLEFVGSATLTDDPAAIGREMRRTLGLADGWAREAQTWTAAVGLLRRSIESVGVIAVINGVVGNNTRRRLSVSEFRGFALVDALAPLIFVNGADAKSAQMFTLAHELAHLWLGEQAEGVSGFTGIFPDGGAVETFCDKAAAEFLVPQAELRTHWATARRAQDPFGTLARQFKVSPIVIGRRAMDLGLVERSAFFEFYEAYIATERRAASDTGGGDFYNNQNNRIGETFATRVILAAKERRITFKRAYELTGLNGGTFQQYAGRLGVSLP